METWEVKLKISNDDDRPVGAAGGEWVGFRGVVLSRYLVEQSAAKQISSRKELNNVFRVERRRFTRGETVEKLRVYKGAIPSLFLSPSSPPLPPPAPSSPLDFSPAASSVSSLICLSTSVYVPTSSALFLCLLSFVPLFFKQCKFKERSTSLFLL